MPSVFYAVLMTSISSTVDWSISETAQWIRCGDKIIDMLVFESDVSAPWFKGKPVAEALEYTDTKQAINNHVPPQCKNTLRVLLDTQGVVKNRGGTPYPPSHNELNAIFINEPGLYSLVFQSKKKKAIDFQQWVYSVVLPTIRRTGRFAVQDSNSAILCRQIQMPHHLIWSKLNVTDIDFVRDRQVLLQPLILAKENLQVNYLALVRIQGHPDLFVKYGQTDQMYVRVPAHVNDFEEFMCFSIIDTHYNIQSETAFGKALNIGKIRSEPKFVFNERTYKELIPYNERTNLANLELLMRKAIQETHLKMDRSKSRMSAIVRSIIGNTQESEAEQSESFESKDILKKLDDIANKVEKLTLSASSSTEADVNVHVLTTVQESSDQASEQINPHSSPNEESAADADPDIFAKYSRERHKRQKAKIPDRPVEPRLHAKTVPDIAEIDERKGSVEKFIKKYCAIGVDEKRDKWKKTEQYYEPSHSLYNVYKSTTQNPLTYPTFENTLSEYNIIVANRAYATYAEPEEKVNNKSKPSFIGIRLKNPPLTTLQKNIVLFLEDYTEIGDMDKAETPISIMFRAFHEAYPGWTSYYFNQELLAMGYTFGKHHAKGEKAWMGLKLKINETVSIGHTEEEIVTS